MGDRDEGLAPLADVRKLTYKDLRSGLIANYIEKGNKSLIVRADGEETVPGLKQVDDFFKYLSLIHIWNDNRTLSLDCKSLASTCIPPWLRFQVIPRCLLYTSHWPKAHR